MENSLTKVHLGCDPDFGCGIEPGTCANSPPAETLTHTDVGFTSTSFFTITQEFSTDVSETQFFTTIETTNLFSTETVLSSFSTETEASFSVPVASGSTSQALFTPPVPTASQPDSTSTASVTQSSPPVIATAGASSVEAAAVLPAWIASIWLVFAWV